ncbi:hypothetical protein F5B21DRAFT_44316 [Xylaria acuta]|nr:hypothetical protein F5B21DRAFT_44316 [Xylaria acuta]
MKVFSYFLIASASGALSASIDDCPGYTASNVVESDGKLTADLTLAGTACNIYGTDLTDLKLLVEYQTGPYFNSHTFQMRILTELQTLGSTSRFMMLAFKYIKSRNPFCQDPPVRGSLHQMPHSSSS